MGGTYSKESIYFSKMPKTLPNRLNSLFKTSNLYFRFTWPFITQTESLNGGRALHQEGVGEPYPEKTEVKKYLQ